MSNLSMFCLTMNPEHENLIKKINYIPVGLGEKKFHTNILNDKHNLNISKKNPYYGEYTFHYYLWKNNIIKDEKWIGFCQYRKFWLKDSNKFDENNFNDFNKFILKEVDFEDKNYETVIGEEIFVNQFRFSKFVKYNLKKMLFNPKFFFSSSNRNILFHFDMMHGHGNLEKAIDVLDVEEKKDFTKFVNNEVSFNPHNMFICKNKYILYSYYKSVFPWLERCEKIFGFKNLNTYGMKRIYGFLAERYLSYWFKKYTKYKTLPILFKDLSDFL